MTSKVNQKIIINIPTMYEKFEQGIELIEAHFDQIEYYKKNSKLPFAADGMLTGALEEVIKVQMVSLIDTVKITSRAIRYIYFTNLPGNLKGYERLYYINKAVLGDENYINRLKSIISIRNKLENTHVDRIVLQRESVLKDMNFLLGVMRKYSDYVERMKFE
ncbi:hypothetical protein [Bacillus sp. Au-Bac7]|uniref:hypothetical protein n=1 Tax=Bacillus sp. Au-Bac7 TaxID=2906458 RepID=UPI001E570190|nr:hypothetical protein [Bacillus sp. Au-Bac7]MCE4051891.1 hypothetical protein [Bacillus sp. Au-Bac7]